MEGRRALFDALGSLFGYPEPDYAARAAAARSLVESRHPGRGEALDSLCAEARELSLGELEERHTRVFEINPVCALEVGWHVYGEEYARGALLVRLREELDRHGITERSELPDHLIHVLPLLGRLDRELADDLCGRYLLPALDKMIAALEEVETPYRALLELTRELARAEHDPVEVELPVPRSDPPGFRDRLPVLSPSGATCSPAGCGLPHRPTEP